MRKEDNFIIELCKKNKNQYLIELLAESKNFNFKYFLKIINKHLIASFILSEMLKYSIPPSLKNIVSKTAKLYVTETTLRNLNLKHEVTNILKILNTNKIETILMKGLALDFSGLRTNRDLDILIHPDDLLKAIKLLKDVNYEYIGNVINHNLNAKEKNDIRLQFTWNNQYQLYNQSTGLLLELHTNLFERKRIYSINLDNLLDNIKSLWERKIWDKDLNSFKFSNEDHLLLMCMQNAITKSLASNTFALRTLIDIQYLIEQKIKWELLIESAGKYNINSFIYFSLLLSNLVLDVHIPENVTNELKHNSPQKKIFIENIHIKCFNSLRNSSILFSNLYKILSPFIYNAGLILKIKRILLISVILPPKWRMAKVYNIRHNSPLIYLTYLLNPFRWIYLLLKNIFHLH